MLPYSTIEVTKSLENVKPETDTVHPSNINNAAEMHEGKSVETTIIIIIEIILLLGVSLSVRRGCNFIFNGAFKEIKNDRFKTFIVTKNL